MDTSIAIIPVDQFLLKEHVLGVSSAVGSHETLPFDLNFNSLAAACIVVVRQLPVDSLLFDIHRRLDEISKGLLRWTLIHRFEFRDDEGILVQLVSERLLGLVRSSDFFEETWRLFFDSCKTLQVLSSKRWYLVLSLDFSVEIPDENTISLTNTDDLIVVSWVENDGTERIGVTDEALEEEWHGLLSLIVPNFEHVVLTTSEHVARVQADIKTCDGASVAVGYLS